MASKAQNSVAGLNVVFSADVGYVPHLATAIASLMENNPKTVSRLFVLSDAGSDPGFRTLAEWAKARYEVALEIVAISSQALDGLFVSGHVSLATYNRFLLGDVLPRELESVLYLDCDLIVTGSLENLTELNWSERLRPRAPKPVVAAVARDNPAHITPFGHRGENYFNAGVLLLNLREWREQQVAQELFSTARALFGKLHTWDQDVLNLVLEDRWVELSGEFNETTAVDERNDSARIIHFAGSIKPWMVGSNHPHRRDYDSYRALTPFSPYRKEGLGRFLFKTFVPAPLQKPRKLLKRSVRRAKRFVGQLVGR